MDGLLEFLEVVRQHGLVAGHLRGLFHIVIGRRIVGPGDVVISNGITWRVLASLLKQSRYEKELVAEVGADADELAPRDRQRFWYAAIALSRPDSAEAVAQAERLSAALKPLGYTVSPAPAPMLPVTPPKPPATTPKPPAAKTPPPPPPEAPPKKKKK
ncbi:hypothetical protein [Fimbriiglobus ruber]|nr:hypothetical protein [Fimbriiglobus ruber]